MRILAALLLLVASLLSVLLGGGFLLSSGYQRESAKLAARSGAPSGADHLGVASAKLSSPAELAKLRDKQAKKKPRKKPSGRAGLGHLLLGSGLTAAAVAGLFGVVLLFANRARRLVLATIGLGLAASAAGLLTQGLIVLLAIAAGLQLVAAPLAGWARRRTPRAGKKQAA